MKFRSLKSKQTSLKLQEKNNILSTGVQLLLTKVMNKYQIEKNALFLIQKKKQFK